MPVECANHDRLVSEAARLFTGSKVIKNDTIVTARDRAFAYLRKENKNPDQLERWKLACVTMWHTHISEEPPYGPWALEILYSDLQELLARLHSAGIGLDYTDPCPCLWPCPF